jgi:hypothetical protein
MNKERIVLYEDANIRLSLVKRERDIGGPMLVLIFFIIVFILCALGVIN